MKNGLLALFIGLVLLSGCESKKDTIHIATKPMSEQFILGEMLALLIEENSDLHVKITKGSGWWHEQHSSGHGQGRFRPLPGIHGYRLVGDLEKRHATPTRPIVLRVTKRIFPGIRAEMGCPLRL